MTSTYRQIMQQKMPKAKANNKQSGKITAN